MAVTPNTTLIRRLDVALESDGFRRRGEHLERRRGEVIDVLEFRKWSGATRAHTTFSANYGQILVPLYERLNDELPERLHISECQLRGMYTLKDGTAFGFSVRESSDLDAVCADVVTRLRQHVIAPMDARSSVADFIAFWRHGYGGITEAGRDTFMAILCTREGTDDANEWRARARKHVRGPSDEAQLAKLLGAG